MVTVAIPTLNGGPILEQTLSAVGRQQLPAGESVEVLVCDSGSRDGSPAVARRLGAEVIEIPVGSFSHGTTRNLLMQRAQGDHVAFLTQDAVPAHEAWLSTLLAGFSLTDNVGLVFGPYRPRPDASLMVARELTEWFTRFAPDGQPRLDRLDEQDRKLPARALLGPRAFFTDANGCVARAAWAEVPFRPVAYAEDHVLALDMLRAGFVKAFMPSAAVIHSHEYSAWGWLRRAFDEARAIREVYDFAPALSISEAMRNARGLVGADWRWAEARRLPRTPWLLCQSGTHHLMRLAGSMLGARAERLPAALVRWLSLEGRTR